MINHLGKRVYLGTFKTEEEARSAYAKKYQELKYDYFEK
jgi:hypothetical protein